MKRLNILILGMTVLLLTSCVQDPPRHAQPATQAMAPSTTSVPQQQTPKPAPAAPAATATPANATQPQSAQSRRTVEPRQEPGKQQKQASPQNQPSQQTEETDPVPAIIAEAEKAYQSGQENVKAGRNEAAREDFSRAIEILGQRPAEVGAEERIQQEFDKITEEINKLDASAAKEPEGFKEQQPVPAPIDETNQVEPAADPNTTAKAEANLKQIQSDLPLMMNEYVAGYINYFSSRGRGVFEGSWTRSGKYREMILRIFKEEGVPQDLIYMAQAESGFKPQALSRARARGMWQFMASRGVGYGLRRTMWVDDRQDPEKATRAAARHLKDLYNQFGDWYLAMAAYNSGPGNVQQAVRRTGYADFWELYKRNVLPAETKNYVPIILAMTIMSKNAAQYGLDAVQPDPPLHYDAVKVDYPVDLRLVAECVDAPLDLLIDLNPSLLRRTTPKDQPFELHLPEGTKEKYETAIASIPVEKRVVWRYYAVQQGDTLAGVARKYHTTERAIAQANNLDSSEIAADAKLVIPVSGAGANGKIVYSRYPTRYKTHTGDTVLTVAEDFGVPPEKLRRWNRLKGNDLRRGRILTVYKPLAPGEADKAPRRRKRTQKTAAKTATNGGSPANTKPSLSASSR
ncbi:MAG TPA: transglycosylase SLT domain-containing protein [Candidatus Angelobacter sp.]|nr:transglycosylase SLT domain-containing protein [Candidatus Angelobacter sp.]